MNNVIVIHEKDLEDSDKIVIGVADSVENAEAVIEDYYGDFKEISYTDIRDSNLEYSKVLEVEGLDGGHILVEVWLEWFILNSI